VGEQPTTSWRMSDGKLAVIQATGGLYIVAGSRVTCPWLICKKNEEQRIKHFVTEREASATGRTEYV